MCCLLLVQIQNRIIEVKANEKEMLHVRCCNLAACDFPELVDQSFSLVHKFHKDSGFLIEFVEQQHWLQVREIHHCFY